jgi:hypothetical protein
MMTFMRCLQCNAPSAQPRCCEIYLTSHRPRRSNAGKSRISYCHAPHRAARDLHTNECSSKGSFTLIQGTPELAIAGARFALKIRPLLLGGQMEMSDGCGRLALRACEKNYPCPGGPCRPAGGVAVYLPGGGSSGLDGHDRDQALQGFAAVKRADRQGANVHAFVYRAA